MFIAAAVNLAVIATACAADQPVNENVATPAMLGNAATAAVNRATEQLFEAVQSNDINAVQASVASGANIRATDRWGLTAAEIAVDKGNFEIAHFLISIQNAQRSNAQQAAARKTPPLPPAATNPSPAAEPTGSPLTYRAYVTKQKTDNISFGPHSSDHPNPFDPNAPVPGGTLQPISEPRSATPPPPSADVQ